MRRHNLRPLLMRAVASRRFRPSLPTLKVELMNRIHSSLSSRLVIACVISLGGCSALTDFDGVAADGAIGDAGDRDAAVRDDGAVRDDASSDVRVADGAVERDAGAEDGGLDSSVDAGPTGLCARDERVQDDECVSCDAEEFTGRHDPIPGPNTNCDQECPDPPCDDACNLSLGVSCATFEDAYIKASNTGEDDSFGLSVAVSGDTMVVGVPSDDSDATVINGDAENNASRDSGAAFVFVRVAGVWTQQAYLKADNAGAGDEFGGAVAIDGDRIVVGAQLEDSIATDVDGQGDNNELEDHGAAYVFDRTGRAWEQVAYLKGPDAGVVGRFGDNWGISVAVSGRLVAMGSIREDSSSQDDFENNAASNTGAVVVFERGSEDWRRVDYIKAPNIDDEDDFGRSLALDGNTLVIGAPGEDGQFEGIQHSSPVFGDNATNSGAAYVFVLGSEGWAFQAYLKASTLPDPAIGRYAFGASVALDGNRIVVGAPGEGSPATGVGVGPDDEIFTVDTRFASAGAAYVFDRTGATWEQVAYLKASNTEASDSFGVGVAVSGDTVVVSAPGEDGGSGGVNGDNNNDMDGSGAAYIFRRVAGVWSHLAYVKAAFPEAIDRFGNAVDLDGSTLVFGAPLEDSSATGVGGDQDNNEVEDSGAVYVRRLEFE